MSVWCRNKLLVAVLQSVDNLQLLTTSLRSHPLDLASVPFVFTVVGNRDTSPLTCSSLYLAPSLIWLKVSSFTGWIISSSISKVDACRYEGAFQEDSRHATHRDSFDVAKVKSLFVFLILNFKKIISLSLIVCAYWGGSVSHQIMLRAEKTQQGKNL